MKIKECDTAFGAQLDEIAKNQILAKEQRRRLPGIIQENKRRRKIDVALVKTPLRNC